MELVSASAALLEYQLVLKLDKDFAREGRKERDMRNRLLFVLGAMLTLFVPPLIGADRSAGAFPEPPPLVKAALERYHPGLGSDRVVAVRVKELERRGLPQSFIADFRSGTAMTINGHLPIFVNLDSERYRSWERIFVRSTSDVVGMMASIITHEFYHAAGKGELEAYQAQVKMLDELRLTGALTTVSDPFIDEMRRRLEALQRDGPTALASLTLERH